MRSDHLHHPYHILQKSLSGVLCGLVLLFSGCQSVTNAHTASTAAQAGPQVPNIAWTAPAAIPYGTALSATQLDASSNVAGILTYSPTSGTVLDAGLQTLSVTFTPTDSASYSSVTATVPLTVNKAMPVIAWAAPATIIYGTPLSAAQLNASSTVPGVLAYSPAMGTVLDGGCQTLSATFTPTDTANYAPATATVSLAVTSSSYAFETSMARLVIQPDGTVSSFTGSQGGEELLQPAGQPFAMVSKDGTLFPATTFEPSGGIYHVTFGNSGISADYRITASTDAIVVELAATEGDGISAIQLVKLSVPLANSGGTYLTARWDSNFTVSLMGLSPQVDTEVAGTALSASVYPALAMEGQRVAILAAPTSQFLSVAQAVEHEFQLPSPTIDGVWAKLSPDNNKSYLFTDLNEANADDTIRYALMGGFRYILIYESTWSGSVGSYPINATNFPHGEAGLKAVIDKCHAAGLKVGMHMMTSLVAKTDPLVTPTPDPGLLKVGTTSLAVGLDAKAIAVTLTSMPANYVAASSNDMIIDNEIMECKQISGAVLQQCVRGFAGTQAAQHQAGATAQFLAQAYGYYLADLQSPLASAISDKISGVINDAGFDMVYFDGGESNAADGSFWYCVGVQQMQIWQRSTRDLLMVGSGATDWTWHLFARGPHDDYAAVAVKQYLANYQAALQLPADHNSFLPAELGWVGFLQDAPDHPATTPDELEYDAVTMLAQGIPIGLETSYSELEANGRTEEMLTTLGAYEQLRLGGSVSTAVRNQLSQGQWHMTAPGVFQPVQYNEQRIAIPGQASVTLDASMPAQELKFRLQVEPNLATVGDPANIDLVAQNSSVDVSPPGANAAMPGALSNRIAFGSALDLTSHRALAVQLDVEGPAQTSGQVPVLNLQLEADGDTFRDYYIDLNFRGSKTIILPEPGTKRMLAEFWPAASNYPFKAAMYLYNYKDVDALNVRWMRYPAGSGITCNLHLVEALQEQATTLSGLQISAGSAKIAIPASMQTGDYAEYWGDGQIRIFNQSGSLLQTVSASGAPPLGVGVNNLSVSAAEPGTVKLTAISMGN
jgi:hypothetical protein